MHRHRFVLVALMLLVAAAAFPQVRIEVAEGRMAVTINSKLFTALHATRHARTFALNPVLVASGTRVLPAFPIETVGVDPWKSERDAVTLHTDWVMPTGQPALVETRTMTLRGKPDGQRIIDIDVRFTAARSIAPEDTHDAVPGMRPARALEGGRRGRTSSAEGIAGWERLRGSRSPWID